MLLCNCNFITPCKPAQSGVGGCRIRRLHLCRGVKPRLQQVSYILTLNNLMGGFCLGA